MVSQGYCVADDILLQMAAILMPFVTVACCPSFISFVTSLSLDTFFAAEGGVGLDSSCLLQIN